MGFRAGRLSCASLRPTTLRLRANTGRLCPLASGTAISASCTPSVPLCLPRMSCRHVSTQAEHLATRQGSSSGPARKALSVSAEEIGTLVKASQADTENILLEFGKFDKPVTITKLWLRDTCPCHLCVSESSGQKSFATCDIPPNLEIARMKVLEDGGLEVSWANDLVPGAGHHVSTYPLDLFHRLLTNPVAYHRVPTAREIWDLQHFEQDSRSREVSYESWMGDSSRFAEAFRNLFIWGLIIVKDVPETESAVQQVASRIGHLQSTFYGPTWDVVSKPRAENVAYTNEFLGLHQDLMYLPKPPRIQILHCLENSCEGGESLFSDGIRAAHELQLKHQDHYQTLKRVRVDFQYDKGGFYYRHGQRTIASIAVGPVSAKYPHYVFWSPPFQASFWRGLRQQFEQSGPQVDRTHTYLGKWHAAARVFKHSIEDPRNMVQFRLQPGDCVVFDNWRVLHGRREFDTTSGRRHLRGGYIEEQALHSTWVRLQREGLVFSQREAGAFEEERRRARQILGLDGVGRC